MQGQGLGSGSALEAQERAPASRRGPLAPPWPRRVRAWRVAGALISPRPARVLAPEEQAWRREQGLVWRGVQPSSPLVRAFSRVRRLWWVPWLARPPSRELRVWWVPSRALLSPQVSLPGPCQPPWRRGQEQQLFSGARQRVPWLVLVSSSFFWPSWRFVAISGEANKGLLKLSSVVFAKRCPIPKSLIDSRSVSRADLRR